MINRSDYCFFVKPQSSKVSSLITADMPGKVLFFGKAEPAKLDPLESSKILPPDMPVLVTGRERNMFLVRSKSI